MVAFSKIFTAVFAACSALAAPLDNTENALQARQGVTGALIAHRGDSYAVIVLSFLNLPAGFWDGVTDISGALRDQVMTDYLTWMEANDHVTWNWWTNTIGGSYGDVLQHMVQFVTQTECVYQATIQLSAPSSLEMQERIISPLTAWLAAAGVTPRTALLPTKRDIGTAPVLASPIERRSAPQCGPNPGKGAIYKYATGDAQVIPTDGAVGMCIL